MAEPSSTTDVISPLIDALRNTPSPFARCQAAQALLTIVNGQPAHRKAMAKAGAVGLVLDLHVLCAAQDLEGLWEAPLDLARLLVCSEQAAVKDLARGIRASEASRCIGALIILQVGHLPPSPL
jgi:hypothetical protein